MWAALQELVNEVKPTSSSCQRGHTNMMSCLNTGHESGLHGDLWDVEGSDYRELMDMTASTFTKLEQV